MTPPPTGAMLCKVLRRHHEKDTVGGTICVRCGAWLAFTAEGRTLRNVIELRGRKS